jgi:salicylate hydroxylase
MALEDAAVLGGLATEAATLAEAFRRYEQQRQARTARLTIAARRQGAIYHQSGGLRLLRDLALRLAPASLAIRQLDWLYRWKIVG